MRWAFRGMVFPSGSPRVRLSLTQETDHFLPAHSAQFEDQERVAVELLAQQIVDRGDVFAGIRPVRARTFCFQVLQLLGKERQPARS